MNEEYRALASRIQQALPDFERVLGRAESQMEKGRRIGDDSYFDATALNLHGFYAGIERIFEDIAATVEKSVPEGADWHRKLLLQMSAEIKAVRPAVIAQATRNCLDDYRGFRHVVRNVYTFNLRPARLQELTDGLRPCHEMVKNDLNTFIQFLEQLTASDDAS